MKRVNVIISFSVAALALACSTGKTTSSEQTTLPCDVSAVLAQQCNSCHSDPPKFGAPMPLVTLAQLRAPAVTDPSKQVYQLVGQRVHDDAKPMPQAPFPRLTASELSTIDAWVASGAPSVPASALSCGDAGANNSDGGGVDSGTGDAEPGACDPGTHVAPATPWALAAGESDTYVCYEYNLPGDSRYAVQLMPRIDNAAVVHHLLLFKATSPTGYTGTPSKCSSAFGNPGWSLVDGWAPGVSSLKLPPEASLTLDKSAHYVVQVHYNNIGHLSGQTDSSGFDACTEPAPRANEADVIALGATNFPKIPPHATLDWTCDYTAGAKLDGTHLIATWGHMHKIGQSISMLQIPTGGAAPITLIDEPKYSFDAQEWVSKSGVLKSSDTLRTRCLWNNTTSSDVSFGENTADEMCFSFVMYYPKRNFLVWAQPASVSTCGVTK
jgi:hypothetical protein